MSEKEKEGKYICSEHAVNTILEKYNIQIPIDELKKCESIENMIPCVDKHLIDKLVQCKLSSALELDTIKSKVQKGFPVAIRIQNPDKSLHTIVVTQWDDDLAIKVNDETGDYYYTKKDLSMKRYGTYGFYCKKLGGK